MEDITPELKGDKSEKHPQTTYCFIDTETSDLPSNNGRIIELAWKFYNSDGQQLLETSRIISPSGSWEMSKKAQEIHGIKKEDVIKFGSDPMSVFIEFLTDIENYFSQGNVKFVGHNISFDMEMLHNDFIREGINEDLTCMRWLCTQKIGLKYLGIKNSQRLSLEELHRKLFKEGIENAHGALEDVNATARCFYEMKRRKGIKNRM